MRYLEIDIGGSEEHKALRESTHKFAMEVLRPAGVALDALADPARVVAKDSVLWDVFRRYHQLGLHRAMLPRAVGGMAEDLDAMSHVIVGEELGYGDSGLAISLGVSAMPFVLSAMVPSPRHQQLARDYANDNEGKLIGCWAITEPDHGTDWVMGTENPATAPQVRAVRYGDEYIVNGEKSMWVSNGTIATHAALHVGIDQSKGMLGAGVMVLPLDLPGISRTQPLAKLGQRALNQGSIVFQDARVPAEYMVMSPELGVDMAQIMEPLLSRVNGGMSITFAGLARAAFDLAFQYAQDRVQGGVPIFQHQNIKLKLFRMFTLVESARAHMIRTHLYNAAPPDLMPSGCHAVAGKVLSTEAAYQCAHEAVQILGGNGLSKEYPAEKMFRDARAALIEDGVNETLGLLAIDFLAKRCFPGGFCTAT
ncbi:MAG TPA: acyl-CoA dehydrogenase family protein [Polyangiales bacterium]